MLFDFHKRIFDQASALYEALKDIDEDMNTITKCYISILIESLKFWK